MREALFYEQKDEKVVQCKLCPHKCIIKPGKTGFCKVRQNVDGKLFSLVYGKVAGNLAVDPIEKKPLFHFLPGSMVLSFGTVGCNLKCKHCQNWSTSQSNSCQAFEKDFSPEEIVQTAIDKGCQGIAYTYNEPTIFYEFMLETAKAARAKGLKNLAISNGYINPEPLKKLCKYIDGFNIDLKSFSEFFYKDNSKAELKPVLETLKILKEAGVWFEITTLLIPGLNDDLGEINKLCAWITDNLGLDYPVHFSAFHPDFELMNIPATPFTSLLNAYDSAKIHGLKYVYIGNISTRDFENTFCPKCHSLLVERLFFNVKQNNIKDGCCFNCGFKISGVF